MDKKELYDSLVCALTHDLKVCENCKQCPGKDYAEIRINLIKDLAIELGEPLPFIEEAN